MPVIRRCQTIKYYLLPLEGKIEYGERTVGPKIIVRCSNKPKLCPSDLKYTLGKTKMRCSESSSNIFGKFVQQVWCLSYKFAKVSIFELLSKEVKDILAFIKKQFIWSRYRNAFSQPSSSPCLLLSRRLDDSFQRKVAVLISQNLFYD